MITAKEALAQTSENILNSSVKEIARIEYLIMEAVSDGKMHIWLPYCIEGNIRDHLKACGFEVKIHSHYNDYGTIISWETTNID